MNTNEQSLEQNRRDIMRQLGFRETAAAMDIIDPLPYPEAGESDIFSQRLAKGTLRHMTEAEFYAYNRGRSFGEWGQPVRLETQPNADDLNEKSKKRILDAAFGGKDFKVMTRRLSLDDDAELITKLREKLTDDEIQMLSGPYLTTQPIAAIPGDLFAPSMTTPTPAQQSPAIWLQMTQEDVMRELWEWPQLDPLLTRASLKEIEPENCGPHP